MVVKISAVNLRLNHNFSRLLTLFNTKFLLTQRCV